MPAEDPTEELVRKEVRAAREILREDRILAKLGKHFPDEPSTPPTGEPPKDPETPPAPEPKDPKPPKPERKGIWWGEQGSTE